MSLIVTRGWQRTILLMIVTSLVVAMSSSSATAAPSAVLEFSLASSQIVEGPGGTHLVAVVRTRRGVGSVSVSYATANGTAVDGSDFVATSGTLSFPSRNRVQSISVPILDDGNLEPDETFSIVLSAPTGQAVLGSQLTHTVTINDDDNTANQAPVLDPIGNQTVAEDDGLSVPVTGSDPDGDPFSLSINPTLETWATFVDHGDGTATLSATPGFTDAGTYGPYTITTTDGTLSDSEGITITVTDTNRAPTADAQSVTTPQDTAVAITVTGSDPDNDPLTYLLETGPTNGTLSGTMPSVNYTPNPGYLGADSFTFTVSDGNVTSPAATVTMDVAPAGANQAPVLDPVGDQNVAEGATLSATVTGSDPDGDPVAFSMDPALPTWATFVDSGDGTATLTASPGSDDAGTYGPYSITVTDGLLTHSEAILLTATNPPGTCNATPGSLQALIDATPDGQGITNPTVKLIDAEGEGYVLLDVEGQCFENQGTVTVANRYGLWIRRPDTAGTSWRVTNSTYITVSGANLPDGDFTTENSLGVRNEGTRAATMRFKDVIDAYVGSVTVSGETIFDGMTRVETGASFARNSVFGTVEITGAIDGFKLEGSMLSTAPIVSCSPCDRLLFRDLSHP